MKKFFSNGDGMVLVLALWILSILSLFAMVIGIGIRQKLLFVSRIERRDEIHYIAKAGVQAARAVFLNLPDQDYPEETPLKKMFKHNNPDLFQKIFFGENGSAEVSYYHDDQGLDEPVVFYGLEDEGGKLNINFATIDELERIFMLTAGVAFETARDLARAVVDWRTDAEQKITGFYGDDYYSGLNFPYEPKRRPYEQLEEILLVKGMNPDIFNLTKDFLTVFGSGRVNINTAPRPVLLALGISPDVVEIFIHGRNGPDQLPMTEDDYIFRGGGMHFHLDGFLPLKPEEQDQVDYLYAERKLSVSSDIFRARVKAVLTDTAEIRFIDCVFRSGDGKILSWREY